MSYGYGAGDGPHAWAKICPAAAGAHQSPVLINTSSVKHDASLQALSVSLNNVTNQELVVKEHNFQVSGLAGGSLSGGPLNGEYSFVQFHFHWGSGDNWGSEHQVNGISYPSELHLVFKNNKYKTLEEALPNSDGLAVVGVFLEINESANLQPISELCRILGTAKKGDHTHISSPLQLQQLLPADLSRFYTYPGSLTTPPCSECVTWLVLATSIGISSAHLKTLRNTHGSCTTCGRTDNFRPTCPLGSREVRASFK